MCCLLSANFTLSYSNTWPEFCQEQNLFEETDAVICRHGRSKDSGRDWRGLTDVYLKCNCKSKCLRISFIRKQKYALLKFGLNGTMCHTPMYFMFHLGMVRPAIKKKCWNQNWSASNKRSYFKFSNIFKYLNIFKKPFCFTLLTSLFHKL